jgi:hypothetical protein
MAKNFSCPSPGGEYGKFFMSKLWRGYEEIFNIYIAERVERHFFSPN